MKKLRYLVLVLVFLSCTKEEMIHRDSMSERIFPAKDRGQVVPTITETVEQYTSSVSNDCYPEMVDLNGTKRTRITEYKGRGTYYIDYEITLESVTGVGRMTKLIYTGGGKITSITKTSISGASRETYGRQIYNVVYRTRENQHFISLQEDGEHYENPRGIVVIDYYHVNNTCK